MQAVVEAGEPPAPGAGPQPAPATHKSGSPVVGEGSAVDAGATRTRLRPFRPRGLRRWTDLARRRRGSRPPPRREGARASPGTAARRRPPPRPAPPTPTCPTSRGAPWRRRPRRARGTGRGRPVPSPPWCSSSASTKSEVSRHAPPPWALRRDADPFLQRQHADPVQEKRQEAHAHGPCPVMMALGDAGVAAWGSVFAPPVPPPRGGPEMEPVGGGCGPRGGRRGSRGAPHRPRTCPRPWPRLLRRACLAGPGPLGRDAALATSAQSIQLPLI